MNEYWNMTTIKETLDKALGDGVDDVVIGLKDWDGFGLMQKWDIESWGWTWEKGIKDLDGVTGIRFRFIGVGLRVDDEGLMPLP